MTALRMKVMGWFAAFVGALVLGLMLLWLTIFIVGSNAGGLYEALGSLLNMSDNPIAALPGGRIFAAALDNPTYRAFTAAAVAWSLAFLEFLAVSAVFHLFREWARETDTTRSAFFRKHVELIAICGLFGVVILTAIAFEVTSWSSRAHADIALAATGKKGAWLSADNGAGATVAESAHAMAGLGALAFFQLTLGLALGGEFVGYLLRRTGSHLASAIDDVKKIQLGDSWLDSVEAVVGGKKGEYVTRRTALANRRKWYLDRAGRVFDRSLVRRLKAIDLKTLAAIVLAGFVAMSAVSSNARAQEMRPLEVARNNYEPPAMLVTFVLDLSGTQKKTEEQRISDVRAVLRQIAATKSDDLRQTPTDRFVVRIMVVDSFGGEVIWQGTERTITGELTETWWANALASRKNYGRCSNFTSVWVKFAQFAEGARSCDQVVLLLYTDLISEETVKGSSVRCKPKVFGPSPEVPWNALARATTRAYVVPDLVKKAWEEPLRTRGLEERFRMFSGLEPAGRPPLALEDFVAETSCAPEAPLQAANLWRVKQFAAVLLGAIALLATIPFLLARS